MDARGLSPYLDDLSTILCTRRHLYGRVGRAASIRRWLLLYAADKVQKGGVDDPRDQNAIKIGMDLWDRPSLKPKFCSTVVVKIRSLDLHATSGCRRCYTRYYKRVSTKH